MKRTANAEWHGDLKSGTGTISSASGVLSNTNYSFHTRFEDGKGTNQEELLAAGHAGGGGGWGGEKGATRFTIILEKFGDSFGITESHLDLVAKVPGASQEAF